MRFVYDLILNVSTTASCYAVYSQFLTNLIHMLSKEIVVFSFFYFFSFSSRGWGIRNREKIVEHKGSAISFVILIG